MSISSPRPSINLPSSRRTSTSTITSITTRSPSSSRAPSVLGHNASSSTTSTPVPSSQTRRNRAALREFYNLHPPPSNAGTQQQTTGPLGEDDAITSAGGEGAEESGDALQALSDPSFNAETYTTNLLATSTPEDLIRTLNAVIIEALGLEGDKKALVYDNYTTLLEATGMIGRMRRNVDPMAPVTTTLEPALGGIVEIVRGIAGGRGGGGKEEKVGGEEEKKRREKETVKWVLGAPERLKGLKKQGKHDEATAQWEEVQSLLDKWEGVKGVQEVRRKCEDVMKENDTS